MTLTLPKPAFQGSNLGCHTAASRVTSRAVTHAAFQEALRNENTRYTGLKPSNQAGPAPSKGLETI
jgi:hypothetical protein